MDRKNPFKKFLQLVTRYKKIHIYPHNFSGSFFSSPGIHQSHHLDGCQAMGINSFFIEVFWAFTFSITIVALSKLIIIAVIIVIMPYFQLLLHHKVIRNILQRRRVITYCLITDLLGFKSVWDIFQQSWVFLNNPFTHLLGLEIVWYKFQSRWFSARCLVAHPFCLKMVRKKC